MATPSFESLKAHYKELWLKVKIDPGQEANVMGAAKRIFANKARYLAVSAKTGVPWFFIGLIHNLEASLSFRGHLHNGDPLTARTVQVPAGRPLVGSPPFTWEESALDALTQKGLQNIKAWTIERLLYEAERYNGFGYMLYHPGDLSPYVWSKTNHNDGTGKYVTDGKWSGTAFSESQVGFAAGLIALMKLDPTIKFDPNVGALEQTVVGGGVGTVIVAVETAIQNDVSVYQYAPMAIAVLLIVGVAAYIINKRRHS